MSEQAVEIARLRPCRPCGLAAVIQDFGCDCCPLCSHPVLSEGSTWQRNEPFVESIRIDRIWDYEGVPSVRAHPIHGGRPLVASIEWLYENFTEVVTASKCRCQIVGWSRDPAEPHISAQPEWEQADDCPVHVTSVEPGCTCGGMAACQQCQERDAAHDVEATWDEATGRWFHVCRTCWVTSWESAPEMPCQSEVTP